MLELLWLFFLFLLVGCLLEWIYILSLWCLRSGRLECIIIFIKMLKSFFFLKRFRIWRFRVWIWLDGFFIDSVKSCFGFFMISIVRLFFRGCLDLLFWVMRWGWGFLIMRICLEVCIFFLLGVLNWIYLWFLGYVILLMMFEVLLIGCWCMICLRFWSFGDSLLNFLCLLFIRRSIVRMRYSLLWIGCWIMICWKV